VSICGRADKSIGGDEVVRGIMRIIRPAEMVIKCTGCMVLLGVTADDIIENDSGHGASYYCICTNCGRPVSLSRPLIPEYILRGMEKD